MFSHWNKDAAVRSCCGHKRAMQNIYVVQSGKKCCGEAAHKARSLNTEGGKAPRIVE